MCAVHGHAVVLAGALPAAAATEASIEFGFKGPKVLHDGTMVRAENDGFLVHMDVLIGARNKAGAEQIIALLKAGKDHKAQKLATGFADLMDSFRLAGCSRRSSTPSPGTTSRLALWTPRTVASTRSSAWSASFGSPNKRRWAGRATSVARPPRRAAGASGQVQRRDARLIGGLSRVRPCRTRRSARSPTAQCATSVKRSAPRVRSEASVVDLRQSVAPHSYINSAQYRSLCRQRLR